MGYIYIAKDGLLSGRPRQLKIGQTGSMDNRKSSLRCGGIMIEWSLEIGRCITAECRMRELAYEVGFEQVYGTQDFFWYPGDTQFAEFIELVSREFRDYDTAYWESGVVQGKVSR